MPAATNPPSFHAPTRGVPNWVDLHTPHPTLARVFYEAVFDWTYRTGCGAGADTSALTAYQNDRPVAELVERSKSVDDTVPASNWFPYVMVDDLTATLALVEPAGGLVLSSPARRGDAASVATILDPSDALMSLWEPIDFDGAPIGGATNALGWIELETPEVDLAAKFYGELFGWDANEKPARSGAQGPYTVFTLGAEPVAGAVPAAKDDFPASWCPSFAVPDADAAAVLATRNGGVVMAEPIDLCIGRQAVIIDPTGATFAVLGPRSTRPRPL